ncbi:MAG: glycosyltransferase family 4 protein [Myxococcota bacterium]
MLTDDFPPCTGGVATWSAWAVDALRTLGPVEVFARQRPDLAGATGVRGHHFSKHGGRHLALAAWRSLLGADAVLATTWPMATWAARLLPRTTPLHVVLHGSDITTGRPTRAFRRVAARAHVWAVSEHLVRCARSWGAEARVLPVPIPERPRLPGGDRWTFVARAHASKGGERFVRLVAAAGRPADLVGDGPELLRWKALADRLGADLTFHGALHREAVDGVLAHSGAVFLLSQVWTRGSAEGLGLTLLEAAARGLPGIGTNVGGIPEAAGLVLDRPDDPRASLAQIEAWWTERRGQEAQRWVRATHGVAPFLETLEVRSARPT